MERLWVSESLEIRQSLKTYQRIYWLNKNVAYKYQKLVEWS